LRYFGELEDKPESVHELLKHVQRGTVTLVYSAKEQRLNNAVALREYISTIHPEPKNSLGGRSGI
jgi:uncharacterized protein YeaO (DUF488 family)